MGKTNSADLWCFSLKCPKCGSEMKVIAFIKDEEVIEKILRHLDVWDPPRGPPDAKMDFPICFSALCYLQKVHPLNIIDNDNVNYWTVLSFVSTDYPVIFDFRALQRS